MTMTAHGDRCAFRAALGLTRVLLLVVALAGTARGLPSTSYRVQPGPLDTPWTSTVGTAPWPQHPQPQLRRPDAQWRTLNGLWTYAAASSPPAPDEAPPPAPLGREVLVPSCVESALSGIMETNATWMWFARDLPVPDDWRAPGLTVLLHFEAVDYEARVWVNDHELGFHRGGYTAFTVDVTGALHPDGGRDELLVQVFDPTDQDGHVIPHGKQVLIPSHIWYTACSGIWQSVWMESVPDTHITKLDVRADMNGQVWALVHSSSPHPVRTTIALIDSDGHTVHTADGMSDQPVVFAIDAPRLWSPDAPHLYTLRVQLGADAVAGYTGFRTVERGSVAGVPRPLLNGHFVFFFGTLDQGFWPDGIYTPPTYDAMVSDLALVKSLGMNMIRKHIKVESQLFYEACDQLGLLVIQDMPSLTAGSSPNAMQQAEFERQLLVMVDQLKNHPSIATWVIYNEGWGQVPDQKPPYPEFNITQQIQTLDPTRLVDAVTGWYDHGAGDFSDNHNYTESQCGINADPQRIDIQGEFGGLGLNVSIEHLWNVPAAIAGINQTYELAANLSAYNARAHDILGALQSQVARYPCSGAVYTQTTDVEGEINGLLTYDRRLKRVNDTQWRHDIQRLYDTARSWAGTRTPPPPPPLRRRESLDQVPWGRFFNKEKRRMETEKETMSMWE